MYVRERTALISFCLVPLVIFVGNIIHQGHRASLYLAGVCIIGSFIRNLWVRIFAWYWVAWVFLMMVMSALGLFPAIDLQKAVIANGYFAFTMMFYIAVQDSKMNLDRIFDVICIAATIQSFALEHLRVGRTPNLARALALAADEGVPVVVAEAGAPPIERVAAEVLLGVLIWVFGSEDRGVRPGVRHQAHAEVGIPLPGQTASLGVAAAAAYLLVRTAEVRRGGQAEAKPGPGFRAHHASQMPGGTNEIS